jgi:hypothetical protein
MELELGTEKRLTNFSSEEAGELKRQLSEITSPNK